jgi:hypothetical protein
VSFCCNASESVRLSLFVKTLFGKYIMYCDIGYSVSIFCIVCV